MVKLEQLTELVLRAGELLTDTVLSEDVAVKGDSDFVTRADTAVQEFIRRETALLCPEARFIAEENQINDYSGIGAAFVLDPVDGTTNLMHGFGQSAISLAYYEGREGIYGVVYNPFTGELFRAERGCGAYLGDKLIYGKKRDKVADCLAIVEFSPYYKQTSADTFEMIRQLFLRTHDVRAVGSAALDLVYVACGRADIFMSRKLKTWDYAAAQIILREAGCNISDFSGARLMLDGVADVIACTGGVFSELCDFAKNYIE